MIIPCYAQLKVNKFLTWSHPDPAGGGAAGPGPGGVGINDFGCLQGLELDRFILVELITLFGKNRFL